MYEQPVMYCPDSHRRPLHGNRVPVFCRLPHKNGAFLGAFVAYRNTVSSLAFCCEQRKPFLMLNNLQRRKKLDPLSDSVFSRPQCYSVCLFFFLGGGGVVLLGPVLFCCTRENKGSSSWFIVVPLLQSFISSEVIVLPCLMVYECADDVQHSQTKAMWWLKLGCE